MKIKDKIIINTFWLMSEKVINVFGLIFVTSFVAKYIGPSDFGKLNLASYIFSLLQTVAIWGTDTLCVKRISKNRNSGFNLLNSLTLLRTVIFFIIAAPTLIYIYLFSDFITFLFSFAVAISTFVYIQDIYIIANNATYNSKYNVISNVIGLILTLFMRYLIVFFKMDIIFLSAPIVSLTLIPYIIRNIFFTRNNGFVFSHINKDVKSKYSRYIFITGAPLVLSSISVAIYFNTSRLMLGALESSKALGIYAVALTLGSSWSFINNSFITSMTPKLYSTNKDDDAAYYSCVMSQFVILISICYLACFLFVGGFIIHHLYGPGYSSAFIVTIPIILSTCLSSLGMPTSRYIVKNNGYSFLGKKTVFLCLIAIPVSYILIIKFGILGAAYSTLIVEFASLTFLNYFFKKGLILKLHSRLFNPKVIISFVRTGK